MKVLTVRQPWAFAILHLGKDVENRNWSTSYRGPLAIHAAAQFDMTKDEYIYYCETSGWIGSECYKVLADGFGDIKGPNDIRGCIIGTVELYDVLPCDQVDSPWKDGGDGFFCWMLRDPIPLDVPIPAKGQLGFWNVPDEWFEVIK